MTKSKGFTLVELLLSTALFSFVLLFVTASFVQINRAYNKGITVKRIHESTRLIVADMSRTISSTSSNGFDYSAIDNCILVGGARYKWQTGFITTGGSADDWSLIKDREIDCKVDGNANASGTVNLLDPKIIVHNISLTQLGTTNTYRLIIELGSDRDDGGGAPCNQIQDAYCDRASLSTVLTLRS